jgi:hypothetical protein
MLHFHKTNEFIGGYLRIKSYNVLNYNNCSNDRSFPLIHLIPIISIKLGHGINS